MATASDWRNLSAPTLADFEHIAAWAWNRLPSHFRDLCRDLVIRVEDFAADDALAELEIEDAFDLMGLYRGVSLTRRSVSDPPREPDMVYLYRRPILDYWAEGEESLGDLITHVLVHEIGHHFGFSDADMEDIEAEVAD
jgi:predicted Zn-dependent protease with MMP-like domain